MNILFKFMFGAKQRVATSNEQKLLTAIRYEIMPLLAGAPKSAEALPFMSHVNVSCSPSQGVEFGKKTCEDLISRGHRVVPHIAARHVNGPSHTKKLAEWLVMHNIKEVFIIGGDVSIPMYYTDSVQFMRDFLDCEPGVDTVGFAVYPNGHPIIPPEDLLKAALEKQALLSSRGVKGCATSQICFNPEQTLRWIEGARKAGFTTPVNLGLPGVVEKRKLVSLCLRLGITDSLRFLHKNTASVTALLAPGGYDPTSLLAAVASRADELNITGVHCFTFNSTEKTVHWVNAMMGRSTG